MGEEDTVSTYAYCTSLLHMVSQNSCSTYNVTAYVTPTETGSTGEAGTAGNPPFVPGLTGVDRNSTSYA